MIVTAEAVFWTIFAAALFVRWSNPDLWHAARGGEKPMDFAYLNAVVKSTSFPPFDPWFAGGQMNYYYYGFVQVAALAKITAIPPAIAYNLAIATLAALLGSAAFSAGLGLASTRSLAPRRPLLVASAAALFVTVLGNLGELHVLRLKLAGSVANDWWFWNPTRVIHPGEGEPGPISEMPAFTFIFGDLHAHAMALPVAALALALVVGIVRSGATSVRTLAPALAVLALALGTLAVTNTWDLPTYGLLALVGLAIAMLAEGSRGGASSRPGGLARSRRWRIPRVPSVPAPLLVGLRRRPALGGATDPLLRLPHDSRALPLRDRLRARPPGGSRSRSRRARSHAAASSPAGRVGSARRSSAIARSSRRGGCALQRRLLPSRSSS